MLGSLCMSMANELYRCLHIAYAMLLFAYLKPLHHLKSQYAALYKHVVQGCLF